MKLVIESVGNPRSFDTRYGAMNAIPVKFTDGQMGEVTCKQENCTSTLERLGNLVRQEGEFTLVDQGYFTSGDPKPQKITEYPGKPGAGTVSSGSTRPSGGSREFKADPFKQALIVAENALNNATALACAGMIPVDQIEPKAAEFARTSYALGAELEGSGGAEGMGKAPGPAGSTSGQPEAAGGGDPQETPGEPPSALYDLALDRFGTPAGIVKAARGMFGDTVKAFEDVTDEHLKSLVGA